MSATFFNYRRKTIKHLIACFKIEEQTGNIRFVHVMMAVLNGHNHVEPDWTYVAAK